MPHKITQIKAEETYDLRHTVMWPNQPREFIILDDDKDGICENVNNHCDDANNGFEVQ